MRALALVVVVLSSLTFLPDAAIGQASVEDAVRQTILDQYAFGRDNLRDSEGAYSREGSVEVWSSGGLLQQIPTDTPPAEYTFNTLTPKHITVIPIGADAAVVHMYVEGGFQAEGQEPVTNYLTRGTLVMVLVPAIAFAAGSAAQPDLALHMVVPATRADVNPEHP